MRKKIEISPDQFVLFLLKDFGECRNADCPSLTDPSATGGIAVTTTLKEFDERLFDYEFHDCSYCKSTWTEIKKENGDFVGVFNLEIEVQNSVEYITKESNDGSKISDGD